MNKAVIPSVSHRETCTLTAYATNDRLLIVKHYNYHGFFKDHYDVVKFNRDAYHIDTDFTIGLNGIGLISEKNDLGWVTIDDFAAILKALNL